MTFVYCYFQDVMIFVLNDDDDDGMTRLLYVYDMMRILYVYWDLKLLYRAYTNTSQIRRGGYESVNVGILAAALD